ncbi:unnamed protein product [Schistocephalus solidus]|uniref:Uncharacterized protein n=1 Tax=Schistocephalus solidus TaxID=70667 RepID=A0A183TRE3_SCHSO|nr:unnamed protein product [Schistocephalus solidus]
MSIVWQASTIVSNPQRQHLTPANMLALPTKLPRTNRPRQTSPDTIRQQPDNINGHINKHTYPNSYLISNGIHEDDLRHHGGSHPVGTPRSITNTTLPTLIPVKTTFDAPSTSNNGTVYLHILLAAERSLAQLGSELQGSMERVNSVTD